MRSKLSFASPVTLVRGRTALVALVALVLLALLASSACQRGNRGGEGETGGVVIVNAPAAGEVRRVLVREGMSVPEGAPVVEIAVREETQAQPPAKTEDPVTRAASGITVAQNEIEAARAEVVRTQVEVQRLSPLVATGEATQGQLDGARAEYERAQQRFQKAQTAAQGAQAGLVAARQQAQNPSHAPATTVAPSERIVSARASTGGTVSAISARVGEHVTAGQPLATLRAEQR